MDRCFPRNFHGFNYENTRRNEELIRMGYQPPAPYTTGTTVVGLIFDNGVMIGTDTRATRDNLVTSSKSQKIYQLHKNIICGGSGNCSDLANSAHLLQRQLELHHHFINKRTVRTICAKEMARQLLLSQRGRLMVSFIIGGVDCTGTNLYSVNFDGTSTSVLFVSIGSGHFGAMSILEGRWKLNMDEMEARELMLDAISAGISNDLCSGSSVEVCIVRSDNTVDYCTETIHHSSRNDKVQVRPPMPGATSVTCTRIQDMEVTDERVYALPPLIPSIYMKPIRPDEVRRTFASTMLKQKRPGSDDIDSSQTIKKRRLQ